MAKVEVVRAPSTIAPVRWLGPYPASACRSALAGTLAGRVVVIADGDTLTVLTERREQVRVRLSDIDAPECGQPWGQRLRERLSELAFGRKVKATAQDTHRYG